ncbi:MAG: glucose 1-dehydrogenase [Dehalococcoidia bacterium]
MAEKLFDLTDRVALVTGASSGFGVTFAHGLADAGADVVVAARRLERLEKTAEGVRERGRRCLVVKTDLTQPDQIENLVSRAMEEFGRLDILVNNAARGGVAMWTETTTLEEYRLIMDTNLTSVFLLTQRAGREMLARGWGRIINISSVEGVQAAPEKDPSFGYCTAKHAMAGLTKETAKQWAKRGVTVNQIGPGFFHTELTDRFLSDPQMKAELSALAPMGRVGQPQELMGLLLLLASDASSYITGQTIMVDGGWSIW